MFTAVPAVITTVSPGSTSPAARAASIDGAPELLDVRRPRRSRAASRPTRAPSVWSECWRWVSADDRPARAQARDRRGGAAAEGRDEDRLRLERLGDVAGGVRHRLPDRRVRRSPRGSRAGSRGCGSTARAIRSMTATASTGYSPIAVSPESISAEVPSRIAFATSVASARVGSAWSIIDSSICVAVITGFPRSSALEMIRFCSSGTERRADLDAEVAARDHHRVGLGEDLVERLRSPPPSRSSRSPARSSRASSISGSGGRARRTPSGRTRARRSRRRARARSRGRRGPCASATGSAAARPGG